MRRRIDVILLVLSIPVGLVVSWATANLLGDAWPEAAKSLIGLFVPLFVAGLCMIPFIAPWFDSRAKSDLAEIRARREREEAAGQTAPDTATGKDARRR